MSTGTINGHKVVPIEQVGESDSHDLKISMKQRGCLIEVVIPVETLPDAMQLKDYMQNTAVDMYSRLRFMVASVEHAQGKEH
jgi:hypothetical protein